MNPWVCAGILIGAAGIVVVLVVVISCCVISGRISRSLEEKK